MTTPTRPAPGQLGDFKARKMEPDERERFSSMRTLASVKVPYFASSLFALRPLAAPGLGTFASDDKGRVYIDFEATAEWTIQESAGALIHEVLHVLRRHGRRRSGYCSNVGQVTPAHWNIAADLEINDDIMALSGISMPKGILLPELFKLPPEQLAEWYATELGKMANQNQPSQNGQSSDQDGQGQAGQSDDGLGNHESFCPGVDGVSAENSDSVDKGLSDMQIEVAAKNTAKAIQAHGEKLRRKNGGGSGIGKIPAGFERWAEEELAPPKVNWRDQLRSQLRGRITNWKGHHSYSWKKVGRRAENHETMPGRIGFIPTVKLAIDTSGSMSEDDFAFVLSEVSGICRAAGIKGKGLAVFTVDAQIYEEQSVATAKDIVLTGGGGTDMRLAFDYVTAEPSRKPNILIVATDGYTPWPEERVPGMDAIALITQEGPEVNVPSWITPIVIPSSSER